MEDSSVLRSNADLLQVAFVLGTVICASKVAAEGPDKHEAVANPALQPKLMGLEIGSATFASSRSLFGDGPITNIDLGDGEHPSMCAILIGGTLFLAQTTPLAKEGVIDRVVVADAALVSENVLSSCRESRETHSVLQALKSLSSLSKRNGLEAISNSTPLPPSDLKGFWKESMKGTAESIRQHPCGVDAQGRFCWSHTIYIEKFSQCNQVRGLRISVSEVDLVRDASN
jgi:hypothetical protein